MLIRKREEEPVEINMTPIIDMVFLLLIFFLVATKFADVERDVRIHPPSNSSARPITEVPDEIVVNVTRDARFQISGKSYNLTDIDSLLGRAVAANPRQAVVIRGDREVMLRAAVVVLELCEKHGIERTYLTTRKTKQ